MSDFKRLGREGGLKGFEVPKAIALESDPWTAENGLLTPGLKVKRPNCQRKYESLMNDLYNRLGKADLSN